MSDKLKEQVWSISSILSGLIFLLIYVIYNNAYKTAVANLVDTSNFKILPIWAVVALVSYILFKIGKRDKDGLFKKINYWMNPYFSFLGIWFVLSGLLPSILGAGLFIAFIPVFIKVAIVFRMLRKPFYEYLAGSKISDDNITELKAEPGDFVIGEIYKRNLNEDGETPDGEDDYIPSGKKAVVPLRDRFVHFLALGVTGSGKTSQSLLPMFNRDFTSDNFKFAKVDVVQMGQIVLEPKGDFAKATWAIGKIKEAEKKMNYITFLLGVEQKIVDKIQELAEKRQEYIDRVSKKELTRAEEKEFEKYKILIKNKKTFNSLTAEEQVDIVRKYEYLKHKMNGDELTKYETEERVLIDISIKNLLTVRKELPNYLSFEFEYLNSLTPFALFRYASLLTTIISDPDKYELSWNDLKAQDPHQERDLVMLFDPSAHNSLCFNPLFGPEERAVATVKETLIAFMSDSSSFFKNSAETLLQNAIKVAKRVHGDDATLLHLNDLLTNSNGRGDEMLRQLGMVSTTSSKTLENREIIFWFNTDYYSAIKGMRGGSKTYEHTSGIRSILANLLDSKRIRSVLCPPPGVGTDLNFDEILRTGDKVAISTSTGLSDRIGGMLGSFIMLQLQSAIFRRHGGEDTRLPVILYIDEFQDYANPEFEGVLTKGRSYAVSATMATQTLGIVGEKAGDGLVQNLQSNARNVIVYPGASAQDADYFVKKFGTTEETKVKRSLSKEVARYKIDEIKQDMGIDSVQRESLSEDTKSVDRFTKAQIMYGPNHRTRSVGGNDAFGYIYYLIIVKNSPQLPSVAKIQYIPKDLKEKTDRLVAAYDQNNRIQPNEEDTVIESNSEDDPFEKEEIHQSETVSELTTGTTRESDPSVLARDFSGNFQDLSSISPIVEPDFGKIDFNSGDLPQFDLEEIKPVEIPDGDSPFKVNPEDLANFEIKF